MRHNDHVDFGLIALLDDLIENDYLEVGSSAHGIVLQVIDKGFDSLSEKQVYVYNTIVEDALERRAQEIEISKIRDSKPK